MFPIQSTATPVPTPVAPSDAGGVVRTVVAEFVDGVLVALPRVVSAVVFLVVAYVAIRVVREVLKGVLETVYADDERLIVDLTVSVVGLFLWFGAILVLLKVVGMGDVAASLGTAGGFVGLGVAFALKDMLADTVAGVYLLQDPDFTVGDRVTAASVTGAVEGIDLRKTRIRTDEGDLVVVANSEVEKKWTREAPEAVAVDEAGTGSGEDAAGLTADADPNADGG